MDPDDSQDDELQIAAAGATAAAGIAGLALGPVGLLFPAAVQAAFMIPMGRRQRRWLNELGERIQALEDEGLDLAALGDDEEFVTVVATASQAALRTHQEDKRQALLAAVEHSAHRDLDGIDGDRRLLFVRYIDDLTVSHMQLLVFLQDPPAAVAAAGTEGTSFGTLEAALRVAHPHLVGDTEFLQGLLADLTLRALSQEASIRTNMSRTGWESRRTTTLGDRFISFIQ